jgi:hypothetical protein
MWGHRDRAPLILKFVTRCRRVVSSTQLLPGHWGNSPHYPQNRKLSGYQIRSGFFEEETNRPHLPEIDYATHQPIA